VLAFGTRETSLRQPVEHLPGGADCRVRVVALDPFQTVVATSAPFAVETHAPWVRISSIGRGQALPLGAAVTVQGFGYDVEDGSLPAEALRWSVNEKTPIGTGTHAVIPDLGPGKHTLTLEATDREGKTARTSVEFVVSLKTEVGSPPDPNR
jgi:hypothetical protein